MTPSRRIADFDENPDHRSDHRPDLKAIYFKLVADSAAYDGLRIKVGESGNKARRDKQHAASHLGRRFHIEDLCALRGTVGNESAIKQAFAPHAWGGEIEIFEPCPEVVDYIRWLRDQYYVWTPDDPDCLPVESLDVVDASHWLPGPGRTKPAPNELPGLWGPLSLPPREITGDDFYTAPEVIEAARAVLGHIDLDPASHAVANRVVKAARFYSIAENGLTKKWRGNVWLNPPFSQWKQWVPKVISEWRSGRVSAMLALSAMRTVTAQYFNPFLMECSGMCIMQGRRRFWGGVAGDSPDDGHAVYYFGPNFPRFAASFGAFGAVFPAPGRAA